LSSDTMLCWAGLPKVWRN